MPEHTPAPTPARCLYGFFMYLFSKTILAFYLIWSITPDNVLHYINIYYYPQKYWSTAIPIQCLVALTMFAFLVYPSSNLMLTTKINCNNTILDSFSESFKSIPDYKHTAGIKCICKDVNKCMKQSYLATSKELKDNTVPLLHDLDMRFVCTKLYLNQNKKIEY